MSGRAFLDTNVLVYTYSLKEPEKRNAAYRIFDRYTCVTSLQVFNEASNVWFKKLGWNGETIQKHLDNFSLICDEILSVERKTVNLALRLKDTYGFSYYDSLMLASALEGECGVIFSEDMNAGQRIEQTLTITNPFQ
jgi:predicted nucleic acid-binding protein